MYLPFPNELRLERFHPARRAMVGTGTPDPPSLHDGIALPA
jgi:hypothetical protein